MTRQEFIAGYVERSGINPKCVVSNGFVLSGERHLALPCICKEKDCDGWAMINEKHMSHHLFFNAPEPLRDLFREAMGNEP